MIKTGACYDQLEPEIASELKYRVHKISETRCLQDLFSEFLDQNSERNYYNNSFNQSQTWEEGEQVDNLINGLDRKIAY